MRNKRWKDEELEQKEKPKRELSEEESDIFDLSILLLLLGLLPLILMGCGFAGTAHSGSITVLTALPEEQTKPYLVAFSAEHPNIRVDLVHESAQELTERLLAVEENPAADVIWGVPTSNLLLVEWYDIVEPYAPAGIERVPMRFRDQAETPHWVGINAGMSAFCVNSSQIERLGLPMPQSWSDLLDPVYEGHLVMADPNDSRNSFLTVSGILQLYGDTRGWQYLDQLDTNIGSYTANSTDSCQLVARGEHPIGISYGVAAQEVASASLELIFPSEGSGWLLAGNALIDKEQIKPAAKTFLDWAISDAAMEQYAQHWVITAVETDQPIPESFPNNPAEQLIENNLPWVAANRDSILSEWSERYDNKS